MLSFLQISPDGKLLSGDSQAAVKSHMAEAGVITWVDVEDGTDAEWERILDLYPFHPLAVDDCRSSAQRPKLEEYPGHLLVVFQGLNLNPGTEHLDTVELDLLLTPGLLVTVRDTPLKAIDEVRTKALRNPEFFSRGADRLLHAVLDRTVDFYFPLAEELEARLDTIESGLSARPDSGTYERIFALKKQLLAFRRFVAPQRDIVNALSFRPLVGVREETHIYFRDIHDHLIRIHDQLETMRDMTTGVLDAYMTQMSQRTNEIIKVLTIMGSILLPLTLLTGVFGMNFDAIPGLHHPLGFWVLVGIMLLVAGVVFSVFKRRQWI
jgi:magnesium transporter